jgi:Coenzyme PQQ synthesis protein D (PqqD)
VVEHRNHISPLSTATMVIRSDGFIQAEIENEIVALNIKNGTCYGLNPVGSRIWRLLADPIGIKDICGRLLAEYKVEPNVCERQVLDLLEDLRAEGLITTLEKR